MERGGACQGLVMIEAKIDQALARNSGWDPSISLSYREARTRVCAASERAEEGPLESHR